MRRKSFINVPFVKKDLIQKSIQNYILKEFMRRRNHIVVYFAAKNSLTNLNLMNTKKKYMKKTSHSVVQSVITSAQEEIL